MAEERRKFKRESAQARREALICATLELVAEHGVRGATVRGIAERADVTQGLIRHYFSSKEDLITAAYEYHMTHMTDLTEAPASQLQGTARDRLVAFVEASLTAPVVDPQSIALWASFLNKVQNDPAMKAIHARTYADFRDRLEALIAAALGEAGQVTEAGQLRHLAIACNAVIDGLWLEGGALPDAFEPDELPKIGLISVGAIVGLNLTHSS
ncbi:TetR/AcrR family transcriptional regulator [Antarcticimicrobium sediminis]|uniref:TetR family transcriptional regulator n=1 Tax=Antarcticimicrobium sediminis TaxID=2546227 RepID=A0A4R5ESS0_9RHOB|nr:TetR family transcriptional regulator C-terminal domain-containing protein [Antarcticimicrobium sediminis]TDE37919.1 TetR family transcriptional regulator [Antarcticimicrobium sediminis]